MIASPQPSMKQGMPLTTSPIVTTVSSSAGSRAAAQPSLRHRALAKARTTKGKPTHQGK